jgi:hypothetical protein
MTEDGYDLNGINGAENFRSLAVGLKIKLTDGTLCEIAANPGDGAYLVVNVVEDAQNPSRVGEEEVVYFTEVEGVYLPAGSAQ